MCEVKNKNSSLQLQNIKGVGNKLSSKILKEVGGEENLKEIVDNLELEKLISIDGISQRKAIEIMNQLLGNPKQDFLKNERAFQLYDEIIEKILSYSNTDYSKNRILLLAPLKDKNKIEKRIDFVMDAKKLVSDLPIIKLRGLMKNLDEPKDFKLPYDSSKIIIVESDEDNQYLTELGLNQYYPIVTAINSPSFAEEIHNYELIFYIYSEGTLDFGELNNLIMINKEASINEIIPDKIIGYFNDNRFLFNQVAQIRKILNKETVLEDIDPILNSINLAEKENIDLDEILLEVKSYGDDRLKNEIKKVDLEGDEILDLLNHDMPSKLDKIFNDTLKELSEMIYNKTSIHFNPFLEKYPLEIDDNEVHRIKQDLNSKVENNLFDMKIKVASYLSSIKDKAYNEVMEIIKFDYMFTLGSFAYEYDLHRPVIDNDFKLKGAIHLNLALKDSNKIQRIDYELTEDSNIALLTGANSGGKTTLLETISQVSIMTQIGLPVACDSAKVPIFDELYHFSKKRSLDAGAFESFLRVFIPIVTTNSQKLVLLDELEGITELDASVKIISSFIELIKKTDSFAIIVTHMAKELINYTDIRVDGIEAKGLDENYDLIVDRTPRMNYLARSTPELILKRIYENSNGDLKEVYGEILKKFE
ncbi:DNA mismatch repair protein MutS [Methanobrevibacter sp. 87.7]|uniref:MutS-related protein n=1 Tax=Methanobrevibacter sp. 87.7 TaxID=387957 RepID=UPI000B5134C6|nr:DNA mismatch repair protein MutS [Methanobrevibacter sp. 87.7]OWT32472.1 DNA mismatch repair protein MutS [Methanobrevibacter sp. 87.7]